MTHLAPPRPASTPVNSPSPAFLRSVRRRALANFSLRWVGALSVVAIVVGSAMVTKEANVRYRLGALAEVDSHLEVPAIEVDPFEATPEELGALAEAPVESPELAPAAAPAPDTSVWFNGRPVRQGRTLWMTVTAYSPDENSCAGSADGITASLHSVYTNAMRMAAADSRILPLGSMISIPGYDEGRIVPVLDRGGKIKGHRLDVLFPTDASAKAWGVRRLKVVVWEYADGKPADDWRKIRDSRPAR